MKSLVLLEIRQTMLLIFLFFAFGGRRLLKMHLRRLIELLFNTLVVVLHFTFGLPFGLYNY
jgi:hypothetical protein